MGYHIGTKNRSWIPYQITVWCLISVAVVGFSVDGFPYPRPEYLFVLLGLGYGIVFIQIISQTEFSQVSVGFIILSIIIISFVLRWSMWVRVIAASGDHVAHFVGRLRPILNDGTVISDGMYARNPISHIWLGSNAIILDVQLFNARFLSAVYSSLLPLLVIYLGKKIVSLRTSLVAGVLGGGFPLFLRSGAILETESVVLPLFIITTGLFVHLLLNGREIEYRCVFFLCALILVYTHSFYPLLVIGIYGGVLLFTEIERTAVERNTPYSISILSPLAVFLLSFYQVFSSDLGQRRLLMAVLSSGSTSLPSNPISLFIPSEGAIGHSVATGSSKSGPISTVANFGPILILLIVGTVGGVYFVRRGQKSKNSKLFVVLTIVLGVSTVIFLLLFDSSQSFRVGYRLYYFAGVCLIIAAATGFIKIYEIGGYLAIHTEISQLRYIALLLVFTLLVIYSMFSPMSTVGNNVDPTFGGTLEGLTIGDNQQLENIERYTRGGERMTFHQSRIVLLGGSQNRIILNNRGYFVPHGEDLSIGSRTSDCNFADRVWSSDSFAVCYDG